MQKPEHKESRQLCEASLRLSDVALTQEPARDHGTHNHRRCLRTAEDLMTSQEKECANCTMSGELPQKIPAPETRG